MRFWFLLWIFLELLAFYGVAKWIGAFAAILLLILLMVLGSALVRTESLSTLRKVKQQLNRGHPPTEAILSGLMISLASFLLIIPGFLSTLIGIFLLLPAFRRFLTRRFFKKSPDEDSADFLKTAHSQNHVKKGRTIEGDFHRE